jgi:uncharacterized membrane protein
MKMKDVGNKLLDKKEATLAQKERDATQLRRLQTLMDVVFGVLLVRIFSLLPHLVQPETGTVDPLVIFTEGGEKFLMFVIGFVLITIYWMQNNKTTGNLIATDFKHTILSIMQLLFLLLYLYSVRLDMETHSDVLALFMQSVTLALAGFAGVAAWVYASRHPEMVSEAVSNEDANEIRTNILAEPLAALVTIPFAFMGAGLWNLSWLSVIAFGVLLKKRHKKRFETN